MIPTRFHEINGSLPPPLRVSKLSRAIGKTPSNAVTDQPRQQKEPVIIYAHSPKVIHTRAEDFMALVQRLTGRISSSCHEPDIRRNPNAVSESSSIVKEKANGINGDEGNTTSQEHIADVPLFTPSSPKPVFRGFEPDPVLSLNRTDLVSPSVFKFIKEFP